MKSLHVTLLTVSLVSGLAALGSADNTVCAGAPLLVPDGSVQTGDIGAAPAPGLRWFRFVAKASRSYAIMLENLTLPDQQAEIAVPEVLDACGGTPVTINEVADSREPVSYDSLAGVGAARVALLSPGNVTLFFFVNGHINGSNASQFRVRVEETTLFNPLWTTEGGMQTDYQIYNTTTQSCSVRLDLRSNTNGPAPLGAGAVTFSLTGDHSVDRNTGGADLHVASNRHGHATITHDCPPGAIQVEAYASNPSGTRTLPLKVTPARQQR
jgi:hypothetical protein